MKLIVHVTEIRKAKGLTQADLAKLANVSRKTINTIEWPRFWTYRCMTYLNWMMSDCALLRRVKI